MGFRVFDLEKEKWVKKYVYQNANGELFLIKPSIFGFIKRVIFLSDDRYICHRDIELWDKNGKLIFEGDYLEAEVDIDRTVRGVVVYSTELSAYIILCDELSEYFTLGKEVSELIKVIGNVFDGYEE